jgi:hypothetical protein
MVLSRFFSSSQVFKKLTSPKSTVVMPQTPGPVEQVDVWARYVYNTALSSCVLVSGCMVHETHRDYPYS